MKGQAPNMVSSEETANPGVDEKKETRDRKK